MVYPDKPRANVEMQSRIIEPYVSSSKFLSYTTQKTEYVDLFPIEL